MKTTCKICNKKHKNLVGLSNHVRAHGLTAKQYYDKYLKKDNEEKCLNCSKQTIYKGMVVGYNKFCSLKCASSSKFNGMSGRTHTKQVKKVLSIKNTKEKIKKKCKKCNDIFFVRPCEKIKKLFCKKCSKIIKKHKGNNNPMFGRTQSKKSRQKMRKASKKRWLEPVSEETRQKQSIAQINRLIRDGDGARSKKFKTGEFYSKKNKTYIHYGSSYELRAYELLEQMLHVKSYRRCDFFIEYKFNEKTCRYLPDIFIEYICDQNEIIEIKPERHLKTHTNPEKFKAAKKYAKQNNLKFSVWTEKDLFV